VIFSMSRIGRYDASLLLAAGFFACNPLCHALDDSVSEQAYLQDFPVVLSASRLSQPLSEAPNAMTVIDRSMIRASGFRTIADLFRLVPGMYVGNLNGHSPIVAYHGSTEEYSRRMQVLIDGRSVYLPPFSSVDWEDIPLHIDDIERIEVVRGPAAASYGANSLQGVINIITRDAASINGSTISAVKGSEGVADVAAHLGHAGENLDYRFTMAHREDSGYGSAVLNDGKSTNQVNLRSSFHPLGADSMDFQLGYSESARALGIAGKADDLFRNVQASSDFQQVTWLHSQQSGDEIKLHFYHISRKYIDNSYTTVNSAVPVSASTAVDRYDLELQQIAQLGTSNRMVWGAGVRSDHVDSQVNLAVPYTFNQSRFFAHDEWKINPSTLLNAGAMLEDDGMGHNNTSPRLALNYHLTPQHTLRASTSVAYRTPATAEEKANIPGTYVPQPGTYVSQGGLRPEKNLSREIGYLGEFNAAGLTLDARAYSDQVSGIIYADPGLYFWPFSFANLYSANYHGYESTLKYRWSDKSNIIVNYSRQFMSCEISGVPTQPLLLPVLQGLMDECPLAVPDYSGSILLTQQLAHDLQVSAGYYHQGSLKMIGAVPQSMMNRVDLRIAQALGKPGQSGSGELALVVQNAFQDDYTKYSVTNETNNMLFKRRAYIAASFNF
jgi:iron complex outermembrane receptor protein